MKYITVIVLAVATLITIGCAVALPYRECNSTVFVGYPNSDGSIKYVPENRIVNCAVSDKE
mgnify:FL=1